MATSDPIWDWRCQRCGSAVNPLAYRNTPFILSNLCYYRCCLICFCDFIEGLRDWIKGED